MLFNPLVFADTHSPPVPAQSAGESQNGVHVAVRQSHHVPAGQALSSRHASYGAITCDASGTQCVWPVCSSAIVQRWPDGQSSAWPSRRHIAGKPELLELLVVVEEVDDVVLDVVPPPDPPLPWPPAPDVPYLNVGYPHAAAPAASVAPNAILRSQAMASGDDTRGARPLRGNRNEISVSPSSPASSWS
jgi:hypothetical protein